MNVLLIVASIGTVVSAIVAVLQELRVWRLRREIERREP